ncbi:16S rRNA (uracil(1498)-N(3))-methyltransferase [Pararobbsia silviterrae]|uniref:Ribosomal RNA small subunit methyltransferase E n=2 Tax=Pararobbsia silviterrae TaxID=1792498 RepID=A0A494XJ81_9BURK|nr:16S rRNA (uracil(1498)-N(3))-methyltransferase [Pararobbsia silviterrae]
MPRFFIDTLLQSIPPGVPLTLPEDVARHIQVLRLAPDDALTLFDGSGGEYHARLDTLGKRSASVTLGEHDPREAETPYAITLAQGIAGGDKMDWILEKAVELGVRRMVPLSTTRSVVRLNGERAQRRTEHWRGIARAACEQCGRNRVPEVDAPTDFDAWVDAPRTGDTLRIMLSPRAEGGLERLPEQAPQHDVELLIGPEGGLSPEEETAALAAGYRPLSLGRRVLRTETAGLAVLAALATRWSGW